MSYTTLAELITALTTTTVTAQSATDGTSAITLRLNPTAYGVSTATATAAAATTTSTTAAVNAVIATSSTAVQLGEYPTVITQPVSGVFSGTFSGPLTGTVTGNVTGNASTATTAVNLSGGRVVASSVTSAGPMIAQQNLTVGGYAAVTGTTAMTTATVSQQLYVQGSIVYNNQTMPNPNTQLAISMALGS